MSGMGRTGSLHAWQQEPNFRGPDLQMIGKSLGGGFISLSGLLVGEKVESILRTGTGTISHSQTFQVCKLKLKRRKITAF